MATKRMTELSNDLIKVASQIKLLNGEIDKFKKNNATAAEIEAKFGTKLRETQDAYVKTVDAVVKYSKANKGNALSNKALTDGLVRLSSKLNEARVAHNSLIGTKNRQTEADKKLIEAEKRLATQQKKNAELTENLARAAEKAQAATRKRGDFFGGLSEAFSPNSIGRAIGSVTKFVSVYTILQSVTSAVKDAIFGSVKAFIDFEDGLGRLGAVTGASAQQMKVLGDRAREVAVQTRFTTTEVVALQVSLAKLGATAEEIPDLIFPIALAAQATGESLDAVGETIVKVNNQFGLSSAEVAITAQTLVAAINESALSLDSFGTAIQYVGPIANQVGLTFQETAAFLGVLADNGFSASRIGTGLRTIFTDLKESGVDLTDTLKDLSNQNIGVAEATDLVGRRAAAQLLVLLQNIDVVEELSTVEEGLRSTLAASASQMATTAGQAQILKSAYEELQISIGEVITNSNLFISVIRLISRESAQLALGYRDLDKITKELGRDINDEIGLALKNTGKEFEQLQRIIEQSSLGPEFEKIFAAFSEGNIKNIDQVRAALEKVVKPLGGLESLGDTGRDIFGFGGAGVDEAERLLGIVNIFDELIQKSQEALQVGEKRDAIVEAYQDELDEIKNTTNAAERLNKVTSLELTISSDILFLEGEITKEREKGILADQGRIKNLEGIVSGYKQVKNLLSDIIDETEKEDKAAKDARDKRAKADVDDIKRRKAQIREEIKLIREQRQAELKALEDRAKLEGEAATTTEERASIELKLNQDIAALNDKTNQRLEYQFGQFIQLSDDAGEVINKYGGEFPNVVDKLSELVNDLNGDFFDLSNSIKLSLSDVANDAIEDSKKVLSTYKKQVEDLNEKFGENAGKTEEYFTELDKLTSTLGKELLSIADGLNTATAEGQAAYKIILQLLGEVENAAQRPAAGKGDFDWKKFWNEILVDSLNEAIDRSFEALDRFNDVALENTKNRLEAQKAAISAQADIENDILKSQLDNQLITEEEFRNRSETNRKKEIARKNQIDKQIFEAEQKRDKQQALSDYLQALASVIPELIQSGTADPVALAIKAAITSGFATASYAAEVSAINQRQFFPTQFAEGGMVEGPSHAEGGVPFTVQGRGGYEMEGGEFIVNKRAAAVHRSLLERINGSAKPTPMSGSYAYDSVNRIPTKFAQGGPVSPAEANQLTREQVSYLRAIAEATTSTAVGVNKPVRAFITQTDLRSNDLERRIVNKNSRL